MAGPAESHARSSAAQIFAQGSSQGAAVGLLLDEGGNDSYGSSATSDAYANSTSGAPEAQDSAVAFSDSAYSKAQAFGDATGYGELSDLGGDDSYVTANTSTVMAQPKTDLAAKAATSDVQSTVGPNGFALFSDTSAQTDTDVFKQTPAALTCAGARGGAFWVGCGQGVSLGINP
jgi:hypothetical protein